MAPPSILYSIRATTPDHIFCPYEISMVIWMRYYRYQSARNLIENQTSESTVAYNGKLWACRFPKLTTPIFSLSTLNGGVLVWIGITRHARVSMISVVWSISERKKNYPFLVHCVSVVSGIGDKFDWDETKTKYHVLILF